MSPAKNNSGVPSPADLEARAQVAQRLLESCRPERYVYLAFAGTAAVGVIAALVWMVIAKQSGLLEVGTLTSCSGLVTVTGYRILRIQSVLFNVVFGTKL